MTLEEFGKSVKQKHPEYNDIQDSELGQKILDKYPQYQDLVQQNTTTTSAAAPPQSGGFLGAVGRGISGFAKGLVKPVVQTLAAPIQAGVSAYQYAKDPLKEADVDVTLPWLGKIDAPTSVKQQVGRSLETVALGLGPVAGGAAFGAGGALEENKSLPEAALYAGFGAVLGKAGDFAFSKAGEGIQKLSKMTFKGVQDVIEKSSIPLTQLQKTKFSTELNRASEFLINHGVKGDNVAKLESVEKIGDSYETILQDFLTKNNTKIAPASKSSIISELEKLKPKMMRDNPDATVIEKQINSAIENIKNQYRNEKIPIDRLNVLKRSTFKNAYNKAGDKVLDDVEFAIGDVYKTSIEDATRGFNIDSVTGKPQSIKEFNYDYGSLLNAKKLLTLVQGKNVVSATSTRLITSILGAFLGYEAGGEKGAIIGGGLGLAGLGKSEIIKPLIEVIAGAGTRSQLVGALKYLEENLAKSGVEKLTGPTSKFLEKAGGAIMGIPETLREAPKAKIPGTPEIPYGKIGQSIKNKIKYPGIKAGR
jgi:hypothetical protein